MCHMQLDSNQATSFVYIYGQKWTLYWIFALRKGINFQETAQDQYFQHYDVLQ
jgi:hypothetical protein